tara:strand:+ start:1350 stop:1775 length:426 start_codon:yes stop_codon:yes gene_type:complete
MRYYETLYIVDPNLDSKILEKAMTEIEKELSKTKSNVINHRIWDKKRLAYQVLNHKYGSYIILQFEVGDLTKIRDFDIWMKLNGTVLRHMTVSLPQKPEVYIEPAVDLNEEEEITLSSKDVKPDTNDNEPNVELDNTEESK